MTSDMARRTLLKQSAALVGGAALTTTAGVTLLAPPARAAGPSSNPERSRVLTGKPSANGWEMEKVVDDGGSVWHRPVPGSGMSAAIRIGDVEIALIHVIRRFLYEVDELRTGDIVGWRSPGKVHWGLSESNQASGTAVQIRPGHYPPGVRGGFFPHQELVVRDILADLEGIVRWGGDDTEPDESLFYLDVPPGDFRLPQVAGKIRGWNPTPGEGAGVIVDPSLPSRRRRAATLGR
ncbi:hypothetical protein ABZS76_02710 [Streptomyces sp. NPDC005562]|uniref:hypothetical protein n=1 Tax=Streptomyces sp. NPDC005562 TaxID=3154890 RepID=UPI0033B29FD2